MRGSLVNVKMSPEFDFLNQCTPKDRHPHIVYKPLILTKSWGVKCTRSTTRTGRPTRTGDPIEVRVVASRKDRRL